MVSLFAVSMINVISCSVVRLTPRFSHQSDNVGYCTFASQVIRFTRICNNIDGVRVQILFLFNLFVSLGFDPCKLIKTFTNCINRHKFSEKFKLLAISFLLYLFKIFINVCVILNKFDTWCDILNM